MRRPPILPVGAHARKAALSTAASAPSLLWQRKWCLGRPISAPWPNRPQTKNRRARYARGHPSPRPDGAGWHSHSQRPTPPRRKVATGSTAQPAAKTSRWVAQESRESTIGSQHLAAGGAAADWAASAGIAQTRARRAQARRPLAQEADGYLNCNAAAGCRGQPQEAYSRDTRQLQRGAKRDDPP